jgi:hypothetical protein
MTSNQWFGIVMVFLVLGVLPVCWGLTAWLAGIHTASQARMAMGILGQMSPADQATAIKTAASTLERRS